MADPFLDAHRYIPGLFVLGYLLTPISIRDQMLRARWLADRLHEQKEIISGARVLVVGAGAAGATAAIRAAQLGANVLLSEQAGGAFSVQARSSSRWIDPAQYDWPAEHWDRASYPWRAPAMPLAFHADFAANLAMHWSTLLARHTFRMPRLTFQSRLRVSGFAPGGAPGTFKVSFTGPRGSTTQQFDLIIWASGFGQENCTVGSLTGAPFWSTDQLTDTHCGEPFPPEVLILGSGDGALQDFLRTATKCKSAREIADNLDFPEEIDAEAARIEDDFHRALVWCSPRSRDEARLYAKRHQRYEALLQVIIADHPAVMAEAKKMIRSDVQKLAIAYSKPYLTGFYGLNCFLTLIIGEAWSRELSLPIDEVLMSEWEAAGAGPSASILPPNHWVTLNRAPGAAPSASGTPYTYLADIVVVRFGILPPALPAPPPGAWPPLLPPIPRTRHLFPFHLPH